MPDHGFDAFTTDQGRPQAARTDYEHMAARYDEDRARWSVPQDELLALRPFVRVIDLGCGTGRWITAQRDPDRDSRVVVVGADPSAAMLGVARAKGIRNIVRARAEDLPFSDGTADYIVCSYAFHQFSDKDQGLDEVVRVLMGGGMFRIHNIEPAAGGWWLYEFFPEAVAIDALRFWPAARIAEALEARGFVVEVEFESGGDDVAADEALAEAERRVVSQLALLDDDAYSRGLAHLREAAAAPGRTLTSTRSRVCVTARMSVKS